MAQQGRKTISIIMALVFLLQCFVFMPSTANAAVTAESRGSLILGNGTVGYTQTLTDLGGGSFGLTVVLKDASSMTDQSVDKTKSRNGYFTAPADGRYLVELWGGDGGNGNASDYGSGGIGGQGGYVYGIVELKKGETLFYVLGGDGQQTTSTDSGGGANGNGGNAGASTTYTVGGGGGYSAVFKFGQGEFESKYLDSYGNLTADFVSEDDRTSRHIMIAGGGGGGGAGSGGFISLLQDAGNPPNGGSGGSVGDMTAVASDGGTVFVGGNGSTSGTSDTYVGQGATEVPGSVEHTILLGDWFSGLQPNDWYVTYNGDYPGGNGGAGNLRGGAGGAGYAGGSGGVQTEVVVPTNVGGGGGGSSYLAAGIDYQSVTQDMLHAAGNDGDQGGMIVITALDTGAKTSFQNITLTIDPTQYFSLGAGFEITQGPNGEYISEQGWTLTSSDTDSWSISGIDLTKGAQTVSLIFSRATGFAGGNGVPLLDGNSLELSAPDPENSGSPFVSTLNLAERCAFANVPLQFPVAGKTHQTDKAGTEVSVSLLYDPDTRPVDLSGWQYDFISQVSEYEVYLLDGTRIDSAVVTPASTTYYYVGYTVTPKAGAVAAVGEKVTTTFVKATAAVIVKAAGSDWLNGNKVSYEKQLKYENGSYVLSFLASVEAKAMTLSDIPKETFDSTANSYQYVVPASGYYYIQAWGADGGKGADARLSGKGGAGAAGADITGYVYLKKGTTVSISIGAAGADGTSTDGFLGIGRVNYGGQGGGASGVMVNGSYILIAGGGGGGGGASGTNDGADASANTTIDASGTAVTSLANYNGVKGKDGNGSDNDTGASGASYRKSDVVMTDTSSLGAEAQAIIASLSTSKGTTTAGLVVITPVQLDTSDLSPAVNLVDYSLYTQISRYFEVTGVSLTDNNANQTTSYEVVSAVNGDNLVTVPDFDLETKTVEAVDQEGKPISILTGAFRIDITLKPKEGFAGGNNEPLLQYHEGSLGNENVPFGMRLSQPDSTQKDQYIDINVPEQASTDFANVEINVSSLGVITQSPEADRTIDITSGQNTDGVSPGAIYTWTNDFADDWRFDFVEPYHTLTKAGDTENLLYEEKILPDPLKTTQYTVTYGLAPTYNAVETSAVVTEAVEPRTATAAVTVIVIPRVRYDITNMSVEVTDDKDLTTVDGVLYGAVKDPSRDYSATLKADVGYKLPDEVFVAGNDGSTVPVEYDQSTGHFTIPSEYLAGTLTLTAAAVENSYSVTFYVQKAPDSTEFEVISGGTYGIGASLDSLPVPTPEAQYGYSFVWDWGDGVTQKPAVMPDKNLMVTGVYNPVNVAVTIRYLNKNNNEQLREVTVQVPFGTEYAFTPDRIDGYVAENTSYSTGVIDKTDPQTVTVYCIPNEGLLTVNYSYTNGKEATFTTQTIKTDASYSIDVTKTGYIAKDSNGNVITQISGTVSAEDAAQGLVFDVVYTPKTYALTFLPNGGALEFDGITVEFDNVYGMDVSRNVLGFPKAVRTGYTLECWFVDANGNGIYDSGERRIDTDTPVDAEGDVILTPSWQQNQSRVTLIFRDTQGNGISILHDGTMLSSVTYTGGVGDPVTGITIPDDDSGDYARVSNTEIPAVYTPANQYVYVYYRYTYHTLTIYYQYADGGEAASVYEEIFKEGNPYSVVSPVIDGYTASQGAVSGVMGTVDIEVTVIYTETGAEQVISVTVTWGSLDFVYDYGQWNPETHQYDNAGIEPATNLGNNVTVSNNEESTVAVWVEFRYTPRTEYSGLTGYYTDGNSNRLPAGAWLAVGDQETAYFWLEGTLPPGVTGTQTVGDCIVTISVPEADAGG